jgi:ketosteroid isomerase-like protein
MTDHDAIANQLARYARGVDERDFATVAALFTDDAVIDYAVAGGAKLGAADVAAWLGRSLAMFRMTQHHLGLPVIDVDGDTARTHVPVIATHVQARRDGTETSAVLYGTYAHEWRRTSAGWRIRSLRFDSHFAAGTFLPPSEVQLFPAPAAR